VQSAGALLGALLAWRWAHRRAQEPPDSPHMTGIPALAVAW